MIQIADSTPNAAGVFIRLRYEPLTDGVYVEMWSGMVRIGGEHLVDRSGLIGVLEAFLTSTASVISIPPASVPPDN